VALKVKVAGEVDKTGEGAGADTVNVTVMVAGEPDVPAEVTVMCPVYVEAVRVPRAAEICNDCGAVPLAGVTESHVESLLAVNARVPAPVLETVAVAGDGPELPPCVAPNKILDGETERIEEAVPLEP
jgi:hypothetical protein